VTLLAEKGKELQRKYDMSKLGKRFHKLLFVDFGFGG
jgi:hypothetical protein